MNVWGLFLIVSLLSNGSLGGLILLELVSLDRHLVGTPNHRTNRARPLSEDVLNAGLVIHVATGGVPHGLLHLNLADRADGVNLGLGHFEVIINVC